ncbi:MAG: adenylate/guanylate cyclase domain-containing protein [Terrimicrobiaceae bacterium]|nr:adenylate/guanylate cyclase domain-containing protein [Terrimicrobiaceae bacterium]
MEKDFPSEGAGGKRLQIQWGLSLVLSGICLVWILLSQVPFLSLSGNPSNLGRDGLLAFLEEKTIDARLEVRGWISSPIKVCYVNVDTDSIVAYGSFPWSRAIFAKALEALFERGKVRAVGIDFVFGAAGIPQIGREEAEAGSIELGKVINQYPNVVLAATYGTEIGLLGKKSSFPFVFEKNYDPKDADLPELPNYPVVGPTWGQVGLIDTAVRWVPFFARTEHKTYLPLGLKLFLISRGLDESAVEIQKNRMLIHGADNSPVLEIPLTFGQFVESNWFLPWKENPMVGIASVLGFDRLAREGSEEEKARAEKFFAALNGSVVLIGPTDFLLRDTSEVPLNGSSQVPKVSLHGNLFKTLDSGRFISRPPVWANILLILGLGFGTAWLGIVSQRFSKWGKPLAALLVAGYVALAFLLFAKAEILVPIVAPVGAALSCAFFALLRQLAIEEHQRRRIKNLFGTYVSATVVEEMVEKNTPPRTGGEEVEITAFFTDIVSFSPIAEKLRPKDLVDLMCQYLGECTSAVIDQEGTLDKYVGDAIIAMFGAPLACKDHAAAACRAALALQEAQGRLRERWVHEAKWPEVVGLMQTRVGLHTGTAIVGNIGSELRFNYTMMGDTVNLAQRIEAAGSHYGTEILVSGETMSAASQSDPSLVFRNVDRVLVPGHLHAVDLHELLGQGDAAREKNRTRIAAYEEAKRLYMRGLWADAREVFLRAVAEEPFPAKKNPASVMLARCDRMRDRPPAENFAFPLSKEGNSI